MCTRPKAPHSLIPSARVWGNTTQKAAEAPPWVAPWAAYAVVNKDYGEELTFGIYIQGSYVFGNKLCDYIWTCYVHTISPCQHPRIIARSCLLQLSITIVSRNSWDLLTHLEWNVVELQRTLPADPHRSYLSGKWSELIVKICTWFSPPRT